MKKNWILFFLIILGETIIIINGGLVGMIGFLIVHVTWCYRYYYKEDYKTPVTCEHCLD